MNNKNKMLVFAVMLTMTPFVGATGGEISEGPVGFDAGVGSGGAGTAYAVCDLLATACAATAAAVHHQEAKATGEVPILGTGTVEIEADFGIAAAAHGVRIVLTGEVEGATEVTSTYEEEKIVKGDDKCQWYNPADWGGHCDPDETVKYHVDKEDTNTCNDIYATAVDPSLAGDFIAGSCSSTAGDDVVCMEAKADAAAVSNLGDAKPPTAEATNCDPDAAQNMAAFFAAGAMQMDALEAFETEGEFEPIEKIGSIDEIEAEDEPYVIYISDLPTDLQEDLRSQARAAILETVTDALETNYLGPADGRDLIVSALLESVHAALDDYDGPAFVQFTSGSSEA